jgi:HSP20 family protein
MAEILVHKSDGLDLRTTEETPAEIWFQITENEATIEYAALVEGYDERDIELVLDGDHLIVAAYPEVEPAEDDEDEEDDDWDWSASDEVERGYLGFRQSLPLPSGVTASRIEAELCDGVLTIVVEKAVHTRTGGR